MCKSCVRVCSILLTFCCKLGINEHYVRVIYSLIAYFLLLSAFSFNVSDFLFSRLQVFSCLCFFDLMVVVLILPWVVSGGIASVAQTSNSDKYCSIFFMVSFLIVEGTSLL